MDTAPAADLQTLLIERSLHAVLVRYACLCDERDWEAIDQVFSERSSAEYGGWPLRDRDAVLRMLQRHLGGCGPTQHLLGNLQVTNGPAGPTSRIAVRATHRGAGKLADLSYECMGEYLDRWVLTPQGWRIEHRRMIVTLEFGNRAVLRPAAD